MFLAAFTLRDRAVRLSESEKSLRYPWYASGPEDESAAPENVSSSAAGDTDDVWSFHRRRSVLTRSTKVIIASLTTV